MPENKTIRIAVVDDHGLYRKGLVNLIESLSENFQVCLQAQNGQDFLNRLPNENIPHLAIVDVDMPIMNGYELSEVLMEQHPKIHVLVISMIEDERTLVRMLRNGIKGYLSKDVEPLELKQAIETVASGQFHYNDAVSGKLINVIRMDQHTQTNGYALNDRELEFLKFCSTELTYKEIADKMCLSPKTIDGYRAALFEKLDIKSRVGLAMFAVKNGFVEL